MSLRNGSKVRTTKVLSPHWRYARNERHWVQRHVPILVGAVGVIERSVAAARGDGRPGLAAVRFDFADELVGVPWDSLESAT